LAPDSDSPVLEVRDLRKVYGDLVAVDSVTFSVETGEVFGILGPNGAGKTTTLEMIEGLRAADSGSMSVLGLPVPGAIAKLRQRIGVQLQAAALFQTLSAGETIRLFASFYDAPVDIDGLLARFDLSDKARTHVQDLSGGQRQRLSLALTLINDPELVFLDEPSTGLDPHSRREVWEVIRRMQAAGKTVILTTHYMEEAAQLCQRVAIMDRGKIIALDTPQNLIRSLPFESAIECAVAATRPELEALPAIATAEPLPVDEGAAPRYRLHTRDIGAALHQLIGLGHPVQSMTVHTATLEDVFLALTGRALGVPEEAQPVEAAGGGRRRR
jgi:ABC-2 type transport system ATP-binding protein